jgi:hypothetical protein
MIHPFCYKCVAAVLNSVDSRNCYERNKAQKFNIHLTESSFSAFTLVSEVDQMQKGGTVRIRNSIATTSFKFYFDAAKSIKISIMMQSLRLRVKVTLYRLRKEVHP